MSIEPVQAVFIHGLANKPKKEDLERIWLGALSEPVAGDDGFDLEASGVRCSFVYWADLFYDAPIPAGEYEAVAGTSDEIQASTAAPVAIPKDAWTLALKSKFVEEQSEIPEQPAPKTSEGYERVPLPWFLKERIMDHFVKEAHDYLFDVGGVRETIRQRVLSAISEAPGDYRHVLVGHSQGSFIAYDVLTGVGSCPVINGLMTLGSPLGLDEIQDKLVWTRENGFPTKLEGQWINVYDPLDLVARPDPRLANDFRKNGQEVVIDVEEENWGRWRHSATKYLKGPKLRKALRSLCQREGA